MEPRLDNLSRCLAGATSRREACRLFLSALFGGAAACAAVTSPTTPSCGTSECLGSDNKCYSCPSSYFCSRGSTTSGYSCGNGTADVYCCTSGSNGGTGGTTPCGCPSGWTLNFLTSKCCPSSTPYYYPGTHGIAAPGCYAACPYVGDCGTAYRAC